MSILETTYASYFFAAAALLLGIVALAMFFAYDIRACWRILKDGKGLAPISKKQGAKKFPHGERTQRLDEKLDEKAQEPTALLDMDATEPLGTMVMVQNITMMEAELNDTNT